MEELDAVLDENVDCDPRLLSDFLRSLTRERDELREQLSGTRVVRGGGDEWQRVVVEVRETASQLEAVRATCLELTGGEGNGGSGEDGEGVQLVSSEVCVCASDIEAKTRQLMEVEHLRGYLTWVGQIMELSSGIEFQLSPGGVLSEAVRCHGDLLSVSQQLGSSRCDRLVQYAASSLQFWGDRLRDKVEGDFSAILGELKWPLSSSSFSSQSLQTWDKQRRTFSSLFTLLLKLDPHCPPTGENSSMWDCEKIMSDPLPLPLEQLVQPLRKRFRYHFMGERRTNCKEKPEWYFTQLSAWIRDHTHFLEKQIQPMLEEAGVAHIDARTEFTRGLLQEADAKLRHDLQDMVQDDILMAHLVDELLLFCRELTLLNYPASLPSPLSVLLDEVPFHKWMAMEKQFAVERVSEITTSPTAWSPAYEAATDADDTRVPETAEGFMSLIAGITDRYRSLPSVRHQLRFLELQRDLLLEFHQDLAHNGERLAQGDPLVPQFCAYLNASSYIAAVLREWGEMKFFITLHYHAQELDSSSSALPAVKRPKIDTILQLRKHDPEFAELEGHAFSEISATFSALVESFQGRIVHHILAVFRAGCKKYRTENWHLLAVERDKDSLWREVSPSLSTVLPPLKEQLAFLREQVSVLLFPAIFQQVANHIDQILLSEIVLSSQFGEGGASQLNFDLTSGFLPLLSQHCDELSARQLLERTREACKLLQLLPGSAKLLHELLMGVVKSGEATPLDTYSAAVTTLNEFGVHTLEPVQAHEILSHLITPG